MSNDPISPREVATRLRPLIIAERASVIGVAVAAVVVAVLYGSGSMADTENTLQVMGFDPDRAILIGALIAGAVAAVTVAVAGGRFVVAVLACAATVGLGFWTTFRHESGSALKSRPPDGVFDPIGWSLTVLTLVVAGLIVGWAAAVLGADVRRGARAVYRAAASLARDRTAWRADLPKVAAAILVVVLLVVSLPIFGDMMNFDPDVHMRRAAPPQVGLFVPGSTSGGGAANSGATSTRASVLIPPADLVPGPVVGSLVTAGALSTATPWSAHPPSGGGRTYSVNLPAPWVGGLTDHATIDIYLPPGYDKSTARYPVIYEPHQPLWAWQQGMHFTSILDSLIRSGAVPPEIVIFVDQYGGPYADSQCADSYDGKEWFDRYLGQIVPAWADANLRTIPTRAARSLLGFSTGGYCAAAAITHHPDVFGSAISFSGYFVSGIRTSTTPTAYRPFGGNPVIEAKQSPINIVPSIPAALRSTMFVAFSADPGNTFYGTQITAFAKVLDANGVAVAILPTPLGHSWAAVREEIPAVLAMLAARQAALGVFTGN
ncbi:MAG: alpha/beta hydrolase [Candidatus Limnocylindrales bacterium]